MQETNIDHVKIKLIEGVGHTLDKKVYKESVPVLMEVMEEIDTFIRRK